MPLVPRISVLFLLALCGFSAQLTASERYLDAAIDGDSVRIRTEDGRSFVAPAEPALPDIGAPVGLEQIRVAPDRRAVGWLVQYPNCCTAYPIPLTLVVYADGVRRTYRGSERPIWRWRFLAGGNQIAFHQETTHGGLGRHDELRDVRSGDLIETFDWPVGPDNQPVEDAALPSWAQSLAVVVPEAFIGRWTHTPPPCADFMTEGRLDISDSTLELYAAGGPIIAAQSSGKDAVDLRVAFHEEDGQQRSHWLHLRLSADGSQLHREETDTVYTRCPP